MIKLTPNQSNTIYPSLFSESTSATSNYFLMSMTNLQTRVAEYKVVTKGEVNSRCVELTFNVKSGSEPMFETQDTSFYKYDIYEQTSSSNTDITDVSVLGLRETGKAWIGGASQVTYVKQVEANPTNSVYLQI